MSGLRRGLAVVVAAAAATAALVQAEPRRSGFDDMTPAVQALQRDDTQNPAMLWVADGQRRFAADCAACHDAATMRGVAARYPAFDAAAGRVLNLAGRVNACRERRLLRPRWPVGSDELLAVESYLGHLSRGLPIAPPADARLAPARELGARIWRQRLGQLDLSCAQCHDANAGRRLGGSVIPQGHPTGYPIYRLEWQGMGTLQRRLRGCQVGVRAEPWDWDSDEMLALEAFLMQRAAGMSLETPGVRP